MDFLYDRPSFQMSRYSINSNESDGNYMNAVKRLKVSHSTINRIRSRSYDNRIKFRPTKKKEEKQEESIQIVNNINLYRELEDPGNELMRLELQRIIIMYAEVQTLEDEFETMKR